MLRFDKLYRSISVKAGSHAKISQWLYYTRRCATCSLSPIDWTEEPRPTYFWFHKKFCSLFGVTHSKAAFLADDVILKWSRIDHARSWTRITLKGELVNALVLKTFQPIWYH
jgi:hypothetical protein